MKDVIIKIFRNCTYALGYGVGFIYGFLKSLLTSGFIIFFIVSFIITLTVAAAIRYSAIVNACQENGGTWNKEDNQCV